MQRHFALLTFLTLLFLLARCGNRQSSSIKEAVADSTTGPSTLEFIQLNLSAESQNFKINIGGCSSGYSKSGITSSPFQLYKDDENCTATLTELGFDNTTWSLPGGCCATSAAVLFSATGRADELLSVQKKQDVSSPVVANTTVQFAFRHIKAGANNHLFVTGTPASFPSIGAIPLRDPPNFNLTTSNAITLASLSDPPPTPSADSGNLATFRFKLECGTALSANTCPSADNAQAHDLSDMRAALIKAVWTAAPTRLDLQTAVGASGSTVNTLAKDLPFKGGIQVDLAGPGSLSVTENRKMALIVEYGTREPGHTPEEKSYFYFTFDFATASLAP